MFPVAGDVLEYQVAPDGSRAVYRADQDEDEVFELYSVKVDAGQSPIRLNWPLLDTNDVQPDFVITSDSEHVVFRAGEDPSGIPSLFSVPIEGLEQPSKLDRPDGEVMQFKVSPDGQTVVYEHRYLALDRELRAVPIGGGPYEVVSAPRSIGQTLGYEYELSPDHVAYLAVQDTLGVTELYCGPLDASSAPVKLNTPGKNIQIGYFFSGDSSRVIYRADQATASVFELFSVPVTGGAWVKLSGTMTLGGDVEPGFRLTNSGDQVVYRADQDTNTAYELYLAPVAGGSAPVPLNGVLVTNGSVESDFRLNQSDLRVVYRADEDADGVIQVYSAPTSGTRASVRLNGSLVSGGDVAEFAISPGGGRVVYRADEDLDEVQEVFSVPIAGGTSIKLNPSLSGSKDVEGGFAISPDSTSVVFRADGATNNVIELYSVSITRLTSAVKISRTGLVYSFAIGAGNDFVVYRCKEDLANPDQIEELFTAPLAGGSAATKLHGTLAFGQLTGDIYGYEISSDATFVVYDVSSSSSGGLYVTDIDVPPCATRFLPSGYGPPYEITADGTRMVYKGTDPVLLQGSYYSVPIDGSSAPIKLTGTQAQGGHVQDEFRLSSDSARIVYRAEGQAQFLYELYSAPIDGSAMPVKLNDTLVSGGDVEGDYLISPDSQWVVYRADRDLDNIRELFVVPIDGSAAPIKLNGVLPFSASVKTGFLITPAGDRVLYRADHTILASDELYSVPIDASAPAARISHPPTLNQIGVENSVQLTADGMVAVFKDNSQGSAYQLYSNSILGGGPPVRLNGPLVNRGNVYSFQLGVDGTLVTFDADALVYTRIEVFVVPIDGSSSPVQISGTPALNRVAVAPSITADNAWIVYRADKDIDDVLELYSAPSDGSAVPKKLNPSITGQFQDIGSYALQPGGNWVVYWGDPEVQGQYELFRVPADGSQPSSSVHGILPLASDVQGNSYRITSDGQWLLYIADANVDELFELFFAPIAGPSRRLLSFPLTPSKPPKNLLPGSGVLGTRSLALD